MNPVNNGITAAPQSRPALGREIPDNPQSLAAHAPARLAREASSDSINSGFNVQTQVPATVAKPVDFKSLAGSYAGDHRVPAKDGATAAIEALKNAGGPRSPVGQFKNSRNDHGGTFQSTSTPDVGD